MTEIQQTNIAAANFIIGELYKDKPFNLVLDAGETGALYNITSESHHLHSDFVRKLEATLRQRVSNGTGVILEINSNADLYYHMLSSYIAKHEQPTNNIDQFIQSGEFDKAFKDVFGLPSGVVKSLGEVS
ncbi:hypothetical protein [Acinetobacter haemolyticus]|uniref:hypothetical protein n=1 Tax=Acinetobacter haemolyticus TaxID=29430 RepID=UPI001331EEAB|nr:hypothetical protein [Acinetobacter haemolyticus]QHI17111.1 hypothetical protein AhaeAN4_11195 [Acinetobacter haemolyticus]